MGCKYVPPGTVPALDSLLQDPLEWERVIYHVEYLLSASGALWAMQRVQAGRMCGLHCGGSQLLSR